MLDLHTREHGYTEVEPPFLVNAASLRGTGQLPKFEQDLFKIAGDWDLYLIPTAEVPLTNLHRGEILDGRAAADPLHRLHAVLPQRGRLVRRGRARPDPPAPVRQGRAGEVHDARAVVRRARDADRATPRRCCKRLELPYRTMLLCTGDMGFASAKTYDIEVWLPSQKTYREISSCSNTEAFQARRANIKFRARRHRQGGVRAHAERLGPRRRPHADRDPRELPAEGRLGRRSRRRCGRTWAAGKSSAHGGSARSWRQLSWAFPIVAAAWTPVSTRFRAFWTRNRTRNGDVALRRDWDLYPRPQDDPHDVFPAVVLERDRVRIDRDAVELRRRDSPAAVLGVRRR